MRVAPLKPEGIAGCRPFYRVAAAHGDNHSRVMMGILTDVKKYGALDEKAAVTWYTRAAHQDMAIAAFNRGRCFEDGTGGPVVSPERANHYFGMAAKRDNAGARHCLAGVIFQLAGIWKHIPGGSCALDVCAGLEKPGERATPRVRRLSTFWGNGNSAGVPFVKRATTAILSEETAREARHLCFAARYASVTGG